MKLLLIEDDPSLLAGLSALLRPCYVVETAHTLAQAYARLDDSRYHLIVLDLGLPDGSGLELCRSLRDSGEATPVLVLTGEDGLDRKVALFEAGADDYLTKPFHGPELLARVRALLRRPAPAATSRIRVGDLEIDSAARSVTRGGRAIPLGRKQFDILEYLALHPDRPISRGRLLAELWDSASEIFSNAIDVHVKYLRDQLDRPFDHKFIRTVPGIGYRFETPKGGGIREHPDQRAAAARQPGRP